MTELLENALTATTLDAGEVATNPKTISLRTLTSEVVDSVGLANLAVDITGVGELDVWVDPIHLSQVLTNLLTNAAKYGGDTVAICAIPTGDKVLVSITDNGRGVEPDFVPPPV